jgi:hypothetical protein
MTVLGCLALKSLVASTPAAPFGLPLMPGTNLADYNATIEKLKALKVNVRWENGFDVETALKDLESKSKEADPTHIGIKINLSLSTEAEKPYSHGFVIHRKVNILLLDNPSIYEVFESLVQQTNLEVLVGKNVVLLKSPIDDKTER